MPPKHLTVQCRLQKPHAENRASLTAELTQLQQSGQIRDFELETLVLPDQPVRFPNMYAVSFSGPSAPVVQAFDRLREVDRVFLTPPKAAREREARRSPAGEAGAAAPIAPARNPSPAK